MTKLLRGIALLVVGAVGTAVAGDPPDPILVTGMVHLDPVPSAMTPADSALSISIYLEHRDGLLWYRDFADANGTQLSVQSTGPYAEASVRRGHWSDFASFMPGGSHHLGTHLHPLVKRPWPYGWHELPAASRNDPDSVRKVFADNIPWINQLFTMNGFPAMTNWFLHGTSASYPGMEADLWCAPVPPVPYPNCFEMGEVERGHPWIFRGPWATLPTAPDDTTYVLISAVGGIIGFDQVHGPEGMVWGTVPYQKRDFLRTYLEWREMVRRGERRAVYHFDWMVHPYQLTPTYTGTDGALVRDSITALVEWLTANWIGVTDESGHVVASSANAARIRQRFDAWRAGHPAEADVLQADLAAGDRPLYLRAIHDRLETCFYVDRLTHPDPGITGHELQDRASATAVHVVWSVTGSDHPLVPGPFSGLYDVLAGDGTLQVLPAEAIVVGPEPVLLEPAGVTTARAGRTVCGEPLSVRPNPAHAGSLPEIVLQLERDAQVRLALYDISGRRVSNLLDGRLPGGRHTIRWPAAGIGGPATTPGVYLVLLEADGETAVRKLVRVR